MKLSREAVTRHLSRIQVEGEINEVVLELDFSATAMSVDQGLLVLAPEFPLPEEFPEELGVIDLALMTRLIETAKPEGDMVDLGYEDQRITVDSGKLGKPSIMTADPTVVSTRISEEQIESCMEAIPEKKGPVIPDDLADSIAQYVEMFGAQEMFLECSSRGTEILVGYPQGNFYPVKFPALKAAKGEKYTLILQASTFVRVLKQIEDFSKSTITLCGPGSFVVIDYAGYAYILSPMEEEE